MATAAYIAPGIVIRSRGFYNSASGLIAADWANTSTDAGATSDINSSRWRIVTGTTLNTGASLWTGTSSPIGGRNIGHLALIEVSSTTACVFHVALRGGGGGIHFNWPLTGYGLAWDPSAPTSFKIYETNLFGVLATGTATGTAAAGDLWWMQLEAIGSTIRARVWKAGSTRPGWTSVRDATYPDAGYALIGYENGTAISDTGYFHQSTVYIPDSVGPTPLLFPIIFSGQPAWVPWRSPRHNLGMASKRPIVRRGIPDPSLVVGKSVVARPKPAVRGRPARQRVPEVSAPAIPTVRRQRSSVVRRRSVWDVIPTTAVVVVTARAPDWLARPHRVRGMIRARRGLSVIGAPTDAVPKNRARTAPVLRSRRALSPGAVSSAAAPIITSTKGKRSGIGALRRSSSSRAAVTGLTPITAITRSRRSIGGVRRGASRVLPTDTPTAPAQIVRPDPLRPSLTRRGRVRNFVQAQVVIPRAPDWLARPHRVRGWRFVRGHRAEFPTPQATIPPPTLPLPVIQKRAQRGWLRLRGRSAEYPPAQVIITPKLPLPVVQKRALRGWWNRRPHQQIVLDQAAPPTTLVAKRVKPTAQSKRTAPLSRRQAELVPRAAAGRRFASTKKPRRAELVPVPVVTVPYPLARPVYQRRLVWRRVGRYVAFPWVTNVIIIAAGYQHKVDFTDASVETYTESARVDYTEP